MEFQSNIAVLDFALQKKCAVYVHKKHVGARDEAGLNSLSYRTRGVIKFQGQLRLKHLDNYKLN